LDDSFTLEHLSVGLWSAIQDEHIEEAMEDNILKVNGKWAIFCEIGVCTTIYWGQPLPFYTRRCGGLGPLLNINLLLGLPSKIGFGRRTIWRRGVGIIVGFALFASKLGIRPTISSCAFGSLSRSGLAFLS
jgi:hypothetical protein